jgi:hypothetical protein
MGGQPSPEATGLMAQKPPPIRDRIKDFRRVPAAELKANPLNLRAHPPSQRQAIAESLQLIGIADCLIAYAAPRHQGKLTLIDGHERLEGHALDWPVLILDVTDQEADLLLALLHPIAAMAAPDPAQASQLLAQLQAGMPSLDGLLDDLRRQASGTRLAELEAELPPPQEVYAPRPGLPPARPAVEARGEGEPPADLRGDLQSGQVEEVWVALETIFGTDRVPAAVAALLAEAVRKMEAAGDIGPKNRFQALELWAADYLAG